MEDILCKVYSYRGYEIPIYDDDYGQQFYFIFNNKTYSCGAYNPYPELDIEYIVDSYLDKVHIPEYTAILEFNKEHTEAELRQKSDVLKVFNTENKQKEEVVEEAKTYLKEREQKLCKKNS